jgi:hypothetical protein
MLCCVFWLVSPKCLSGKCLGGKFLRCVNASATASTWMVWYAISSTPFWWHVQCDCSVLFFIIMWHWHWQSPWFASTPCDDAGAMICSMIWWCRVEFLCGRVHLRVGISFVVFVFVFVIVWASRLLFCFSCTSSCGRLVCCFRVRVRLCVVQSQIDEWVSWLPKPILVLLEGGAAWGWRFSGVALLEGGAALGWHCCGVALLGGGTGCLHG